MSAHQTASEPEWLAARKALLAKEKAFTRLRDEMTAAQRALPWAKVEKTYTFDSDAGRVTLGDLFAGRGQLIVQHFMFHPDWSAGCKSCSFWADNFNPAIAHLNQRDVSFAAVSRASLATLNAFRQRMGWTFPWVSSAGSTFNYDYGVSFTAEQAKDGGSYNFGTSRFKGEEAPGLSVFAKDDGTIYHTYSCYARGLDMLNGAYHLLDLVPKGRDEKALSYPMAWVRLHDEYGR
jgi:predicted dithiol-disulfide oxidoreductase (DUF899 family)